MHRPSISFSITVSILALAILGDGCTSDNPTSDRTDTTGVQNPDAGDSGATGSGGGDTTGTGIVSGSSTGSGVVVGISDSAPPISSDGSAPIDASTNCGSTVSRGQPTPLDLFVAMDQSGSMNDDAGGDSKWDLVVKAFQSFVADPNSAGIGLGIQYFGLPTGRLDKDGTIIVSCVVGDYANPSVAIAPLPGNADPFLASLRAHTPDGGTPTLPALQGAVAYAASYAAQHPDRHVAVVLATDGVPNDCDSTVSAVSGAAATAFSGTPSIPTYVIGVGSELAALGAIAAAGGTSSAFIVDTAHDVGAQFLAAMNAVRKAAALPCEYLVPSSDDGGKVDYGKVNVSVLPTASSSEVVLSKVASGDACVAAGGGWFYGATNPTKIELCPQSCQSVDADHGGEVHIDVGCQTRVAIVH